MGCPKNVRSLQAAGGTLVCPVAQQASAVSDVSDAHTLFNSLCCCRVIWLCCQGGAVLTHSLMSGEEILKSVATCMDPPTSQDVKRVVDRVLSLVALSVKAKADSPVEVLNAAPSVSI